MQPIYLDNAATTKPDKDALIEAINYTDENGYFNPSALYQAGRKVKEKLENVRNDILSIFPSTHTLTFTSCGSEGDNMAVFSFARRGNAITSAGEHSAIHNAFNEIKQHGVETRFAPLNKDGSVNIEKLIDLVDDKTTFVSIVHVNNETGAVNDINKIAELIKKKNKNVIFHSDGVQAFLKIDYRMNQYVDLYSVSAHKICGLKGVGALIYNKKLHLKPLIFGGGQEKGLRSGTENMVGIDVFGKVFNKYKNVKENFEKVSLLKATLIEKLKDYVYIISGENSSPYITSISIPGVKGEIMQRVLEDNGVIVGTGSACSSKLGVSRIITNCGLDKSITNGVLRISFIFNTSYEDVLKACDTIINCAEKLRKALK